MEFQKHRILFGKLQNRGKEWVSKRKRILNIQTPSETVSQHRPQFVVL